MTSGAERVTIVIRTKDRPQFLARALDDIAAQTFADWRIQLVNDGGAVAPVDQAVELRRDLLGDRIEVTHVAGGTGSMEAAANLGAQQGAGEFVVIHDDDDTWDPDFLKETVAALDADASAVAVAVKTPIVFERVDRDRIVETGRGTWDPPGDIVTLFDMLMANRVVPISLLVRRSVYDQIGWYDPQLKATGDWEFNLRLVRLGPVPYLADRPLAYWHQRPKASGSSANSTLGARLDHLHFDRIVREQALREYVDQHGVGGLLYLTKYIDERLTHHSLVGIVRRIRARVADKLRRVFRLGRR